MDCCNKGRKRNNWLMPLIVIVIGGGLFAYRQLNLSTALPLVMLILCPLVHGVMFYFIAKSKKEDTPPTV